MCGFGHLKAGRAGPETSSVHECSSPPERRLQSFRRTTLRRRGRHGIYVSLLYISRHSKLNVVSVSVPSLYLDPQIRDWVLFPITLVMVCASICRYARTYMLDDSRYS